MYRPWVRDISDIKLIRIDTALELSQRAERQYWANQEVAAGRV